MFYTQLNQPYKMKKLKNETREVVQNINAELAELIRDTKSKFSNIINIETTEEE